MPLFLQYGFKSVTTDELSRHAGISKKTLYELFKDKDEIVLETIKYVLDTYQKEIDKIALSKKNAIYILIEIITLLDNLIQGMNIVCFSDLQRYYPKAYEFLQNHKQQCVFCDIQQNLRQGIGEGLYRDNLDIDIISMFRVETAYFVFQSSLYEQNKFNMQKVNAEIFYHYLYGIATIKGHKLIDRYLKAKNK
ncbi:MAG: TetR/AcrR family transcriptional regulator [Chitinophagaceae bacterium]